MTAPKISPAKLGALALVLVATWTAPAAAQNPYPPLQHSLIDFVTGLPLSFHLQELFKDPLQRAAFLAAEEDAEGADPKALAAKIKANQLDAKNRIKAVKFLGTVDCVEYPEARDKLILALEQDPVEEVRYEAALALREMLSRGQCQQTGKVKARRFFAHFHPEAVKKQLHPHGWFKPENCLLCQHKLDGRRRDWCLGCCNEEVLNKLANIAYGYDDTCCPVEPSERVREAVIKAMEACGVCCECLQAYADGYGCCVGGMPVEPQEGGVEAVPAEPSEEAVPPEPPAAEESAPPEPNADDTTAVFGPRITEKKAAAAKLSQTSYSPQPRIPVVGALRGYCIVGMKQRNFVKGQREFASVYEERTYFLSSADAKAKFDENPKAYAPAYAGYDPVHFVQNGEPREGRFLREHDGRFFLFVSKENWETFAANPQAYILDGSGDAAK